MPKDTSKPVKASAFNLAPLAQALGAVEEDVRVAKAAEALPLLSEADLVTRLRADRALQTANNNAAIRICAAKHFTECLKLLVANPRVDPMAAGGSAVKELLREYRAARARLMFGANVPELPKIRESLSILLSSPKANVKALDPVTQDSLDQLVFDAMDDGQDQLALGLVKAGAYAPPIILVNKASRLGYSVGFAVELEKHHGFSFDGIDVTQRTILWLLQDTDLFKRIAKQSNAPSVHQLELLGQLQPRLTDEQKDAVLEWVSQPEPEGFDRIAAKYADAARAAGDVDDDLYS